MTGLGDGEGVTTGAGEGEGCCAGAAPMSNTCMQVQPAERLSQPTALRYHAATATATVTAWASFCCECAVGYAPLQPCLSVFSRQPTIVPYCASSSACNRASVTVFVVSAYLQGSQGSIVHLSLQGHHHCGASGCPGYLPYDSSELGTCQGVGVHVGQHHSTID
jgi:hypothetical protein